MKKILLSLVAVAIAMSSNAQTFNGNEMGWTQDLASSGDCAGNNGFTANLDNNTYVNTNFAGPLGVNPSFSSTEKAISIVSNATINTGTMAGWIGFMYNDGTNCSYIAGNGGIDLSTAGNGKAAFYAKATTDGAVLRVYLGSSDAWGPTSSTFNNGDTPAGSIIADITLTTTYQLYVVDFEALNSAVWGAWARNNEVNCWGFDPQTASTTYFVQKVQLGTSVPASVTTVDNNAIGIFPNPASDVVKVDFTDMDQNGAVAKLVNANGVVVFEGAISSTFSVAGYNKGIYMLQVTSGNKVASKKLVIQ